MNSLKTPCKKEFSFRPNEILLFILVLLQDTFTWLLTDLQKEIVPRSSSFTCLCTLLTSSPLIAPPYPPPLQQCNAPGRLCCKKKKISGRGKQQHPRWSGRLNFPIMCVSEWYVPEGSLVRACEGIAPWSLGQTCTLETKHPPSQPDGV